MQRLVLPGEGEGKAEEIPVRGALTVRGMQTTRTGATGQVLGPGVLPGGQAEAVVIDYLRKRLLNSFV